MAIFLLLNTFRKGGCVLAKHMIDVFYFHSNQYTIYNGFETAILKLIISCFVMFSDKTATSNDN